MTLQAVAEAVAGRRAALDREAAGGDLNDPGARKAKLEKLGQALGLTGAGLLVILALSFIIISPFSTAFGVNASISSFYGSVAPWILAAAMPLLVAGVCLAVYPVLDGAPFNRRRPRRVEARPAAQTASLLDPAPEVLTSVTEHTTELLDPNETGDRKPPRARE
ncbi:MAG TPA: hypothetical protein VKC34_05200 [Blastocatellia bacterium]|nr:hypothetical protein [Blastocatellia bacterium]